MDNNDSQNYTVSNNCGQKEDEMARERASGVRMSEGCHGSSDWTSFAFGKSPGLLSPLDNLERPSHAGVDLILTINVVRPVGAPGDTDKVQRLLDHPFDNTSEFCVLLKTELMKG